MRERSNAGHNEFTLTRCLDTTLACLPLLIAVDHSSTSSFGI